MPACPAPTTNQRLLGGIYGALVGDALGVPVEFASREQRRRDPVTGMRGYGTHHQPPGTWSDDGSLLLCTVEALCEEYRPERLAKLFLAWQERGHWAAHGEVFDIGSATSAALGRIRRGSAPEQAGGVEESDNGNGSLMRILPVALRYAAAPLETMLPMAHRISGLTHRHPRSQMACGLYCLVARALLLGMTAPEAYCFMGDQCRQQYAATPFWAERLSFPHLFPYSTGSLPERVTYSMDSLSEEEIDSTGYVVSTLEASLWCLLTTQSFPEAVLRAVNLGEDTDTTGCVTGGLAGVLYGMEAIPTGWVKALAREVEVGGLVERFVEVVSAG